MSYILEALKKSDQQRQRGATPTLQAAQVTAAAPRRPLFMHYGLPAVVLVGAGILIGWLRPWQPEQIPLEPETPAAKPPVLISQPVPPKPLPALREPAKAAPEVPVANPGPVVRPAPGVDGMEQRALISAGTRERGAEAPAPESLSVPAGGAGESTAVSVAELPVQIQQEIPSMAVQLHVYSSIPAERLVSINSRSLREGGFVTPELRLEQVTPDGMIFSFRGYRFQRGIR